ncbi:hypothetical protein CNY89_30745, partial [Amaricoccus sp. HAR-UPW-R2A-40]
GVDAARVQANAKEVGALLLGAVTTFIAGLWLDDAGVDAARVQANAKEVGALLLGAVTTFIAGLWLD